MRRVARVALGLLGVVCLVPLVGCVADAPPVVETAMAGDGQVTLSWQPPPGSVPGSVVGYDVQPYVGSVGLPVVRFDSTDTTQTITGLVNGTTYTFHVRAIHATRGESAWSEPSNAVMYTRPPAIAVTGGLQHSCAVLQDGSGRCWGSNDRGRLGNGVMVLGDSADSSFPVPVSGLSGALAVAAGWSHSCALTGDGVVECWGYNSNGQLGNGSRRNSAVPVVVAMPVGATAITAGGLAHSCAALEDGSARCWGYNVMGQLGNGVNGTSGESPSPVSVVGLVDATGISAGYLHTCAPSSSGAVNCWGHNAYGQLGNGTTIDSTTPVTVNGVTDATAIAAGHRHSCALLAGGNVNCWGHNAYGQLGNGTTIDSTTPVTVNGVTDAIAISAHGNHSCAVIANGTVRCWGQNGYGELGNGTTVDATTPVAVTGLTAAAAIATGDNHSCALLDTGTLRCWGRNDHGELGDGTTEHSSTPVQVAGW